MPKCMTEEEARSWLQENRPYIELIEGSWGGRTAVHSMFRCLREGCGHVWPAKFNNIKSGYGCPKCAGHIKVTEEEAREWLRQNVPTITITENGWGGAASKPSTFRCLRDGCGYEWTAPFSQVKQNRACYRCSGRMLVSEQEAADWLLEHKPEIGIDDGGWGGSASVKSRFRCLVEGCGEVWEQTFVNIKHGYGCPACGIRRAGEKRRITEQEASKWLLENRPNIAIVPGGWGGASTAKSTFCCLEDGCGHSWETSFVRIKSGAVCPECEVERRHLYRLIPESEISGWLSDNRPDVALIPGSWRGHRYPVRFKCLHEGCGLEWETSLFTIKHGIGCPGCAELARKLYKVDGMILDSSWEAITYLYHQKIVHADITRIRCHDKKFGLVYEMDGKRHLWYPDFLIDGVLYEVKPDNGGRFTSEIRKTEAKKKANNKYNYGVVFIGNRKIHQWSRCLCENGYSYDEYQIGTRQITRKTRQK